jgi:hypothetical protein
MKGLQSVYNQIINILKENNVLINIKSSRPYLIKKDDEERINAEAEDLFKKCKIEEYNSKMKAKEAYKLYFDEAYNLPEEAWKDIDAVIMTRLFQEELVVEKQKESEAEYNI